MDGDAVFDELKAINPQGPGRPEQRLRRAEQSSAACSHAGFARFHPEALHQREIARPGAVDHRGLTRDNRLTSGGLPAAARCRCDSASPAPSLRCDRAGSVTELRSALRGILLAIGVKPMARIDSFFKLMSEQKASDLHLSTGNPPMLRINGELVRVDYPAAAERRSQGDGLRDRARRQRSRSSKKRPTSISATKFPASPVIARISSSKNTASPPSSV